MATKNYYSSEYKQAYLTKAELKKAAIDYYIKNIQGKTVVNEDTGLTIAFNKVGKNKTARSLPTANKLIVIEDLLFLMQNATKLNFKNPKPSHVANYGAIGFVNFLIKANIDGKIVKFRIGVMILKGGRFQYNLNEDFY